MSMQTLTPKTITPVINTNITPVIDRSALPKQLAYIVLNVTDMPKALEFYKNTLGLAISHESATWCEIQMGVTLALKLVDATGCASTASSCSAPKLDNKTVVENKTNIENKTNVDLMVKKTGLLFNVVSAQKSYETMKSLGIKLHGEPTAACENNLSFQFEDPFGNIFSAFGK